jgi:hypothetical protein
MDRALGALSPVPHTHIHTHTRWKTNKKVELMFKITMQEMKENLSSVAKSSMGHIEKLTRAIRSETYSH